MERASLSGILLQQKDDGIWLSFTTSKGKSGMFNVDLVFDADTIANTAVREWAREQLASVSVAPVMRSLPSEELESRLAEIADCLNQELRESNGDEFQIQDYLHSDFRPAIRKLVDLNRAR